MADRQPDRTSVRAKVASRLRGAAFVGAVALAAIAAIVVITSLRPGPQSAVAPSASSVLTATASPPVTSSSASSASATPSASAAAVRPDPRFGFLTRNAGPTPAILRTETDPAALASFADPSTAAVSRDGRHVAFIRSGQTGQQLITFDTSTPNAQKSLVDFSGTGESAYAVVWSAESADELLLGVHKDSGGPPGGPQYARLVVVDATSGQMREITRTTSGGWFRPLAWRGTTATAAAMEVGPGGFAMSYVYVHGTTVARHEMGQQIIGNAVRANPEGTHVLHTGSLDRIPRGVTWWPIDRFTEKQEITLADTDISVALWRPGALEIVVYGAPTSKTSAPGARIELWTLSGQRRVVREGSPLALVRIDGSAAITTDGMLVDLATGAATALPVFDGQRTPFLGVRF